MKAFRYFMAGFLLGGASLSGAVAETLIVGNKGEDTVSFIDLSTGQTRAKVGTGKAPHEVAISPNRRQAAVVAYGGASIDIFDIRNAKLLRRIDISLGDGPHGIVWISRRRIVTVAERSQSLLSIDPENGKIQSVSTGAKGSHMVAVSADRRIAYVTNIMSGSVGIFDLKKMEKTGDIQVGGYPEGIALTPDGRELWVGDDSGPRVKVINLDSREIVDTLATDSIAIRLLFSRDGKTAIVSNMASGSLNLFDVATRRALRTIPVSGSRTAMQVTIALSLDGKRVFVAETANSEVAEVDLANGQLLRRIAVGKNGDGLAVAP